MLRLQQWSVLQLLATGAKGRQILENIHRLGGSWHLYQSQNNLDLKALNTFQTRDITDPLIFPLSDPLRLLQYQCHWEDWEMMTCPLEYARALRRQPLTLNDLARISIRKAVGGPNFKESGLELPLPPKMKEFLRATIIPDLLAIYEI